MGANVSSAADGSMVPSRLQALHSSGEWRNQLQSLQTSTQLMAIYFTASWCGPCKFMEPAIIEMAAKFTDVIFVKIDVDELMSVAQQFEVQTMPTFVLIKQGKEVDKVTGVKKDELEKKIQKHRVQV